MLKTPFSIQAGDLSISDPDLAMVLGDLLRAGKQSEFIVASLLSYIKTVEGRKQFIQLIESRVREELVTL